MPAVNEAVRNAVRAAMKEQGLTQEQVAERIGVHRVHVSRMLTGEVGEVSRPWKELLALVGIEAVPVTVKPVTPAPQAGAEATGGEE